MRWRSQFHIALNETQTEGQILHIPTIGRAAHSLSHRDADADTVGVVGTLETDKWLAYRQF